MTEEEYDQHIAPLLLQAARKAEELNGTVLCFVEFGERQDDGKRDNGRTTMLSDPTGYAKLVDMAMRSKGNLDALSIGLLRAHQSCDLDLSETIFLNRMSH